MIPRTECRYATACGEQAFKGPKTDLPATQMSATWCYKCAPLATFKEIDPMHLFKEADTENVKGMGST